MWSTTGSILFSLHSIIYINDIHLSSIKGNFITFADDNVLYTGTKLNDLTSIKNEVLNKIHNRLSANKLFLNINKTKYLIFRTQSKAQTPKKNLQ